MSYPFGTRFPVQRAMVFVGVALLFSSLGAVATSLSQRVFNPLRFPSHRRFDMATSTPSALGQFHYEKELCTYLQPATQLVYGEGDIVVDPLTVHVVFYGNWTEGSEEVKALTSVISSINAPDTSENNTIHKWWRTVQRYKQYDGRPATGNVSLGSVLFDSYSAGATLFSANVSQLLAFPLFAAGNLTVSPSERVVVLLSGDVQLDSFCSGATSDVQSLACSFLDLPFYNGTMARIAYITNSFPNCVQACSSSLFLGGSLASPNRMFGVDDMADKLLLRLAQYALQPSESGYSYVQAGAKTERIMDACMGMYVGALQYAENEEGTFGYTLVANDGGYKFLISPLLDPQTNACVFS